MLAETLNDQMMQMLYLTLIVAAPPLIAAAVIGFVVALFQAVTQIQDQSLPQTAKILAVGILILMFGGMFVSPLISYSRDLFLHFYKFI